MNETAIQAEVPGACGVKVLWGFAGVTSYSGQPLRNISSGAGWVCAGFINTQRCRRVYEEMCSRYTLVYQTPVRVNSNSLNEFFFAVWDVRSSK